MSGSQWRTTWSELSARVSEMDQVLLQNLVAIIRDGITWLSRPMQRYCDLTLGLCDDPCCSATNVFYDRTDMLYLIGLGEACPDGQTRSVGDRACRYLSATGCILPRIYRPYICTWFLCDPQVRLLQQEPTRYQREFQRTLYTIRQARLLLESFYLCSGPEGPAE